VKDPVQYGKYYAPEDVAGILMNIAKKKKLAYLRISGNEPTMHRAHLIRVLASIETKYSFILETNGILIGNDPTYADELSRFTNLHVRVSLKGRARKNSQNSPARTLKDLHFNLGRWKIFDSTE